MTSVYLNHAGTSWPKPDEVIQAMTEGLRAAPGNWATRLEADHGRVCKALGVRQPERLLLTGGATSALNVAITDHDWAAGDRIVISGLEHHALHRPVQQLSDRGVEIDVLPHSDDTPVALDALESLLRRGGVKMIAVTAASNVTGDLLPLEPITSLGRTHGAITLIDAAQVAGWIPIDVEQLGADLVIVTAHKGMQGPLGIGALYVAPHVQMTSPLAACSLEDTLRTCAPMPGYCDVGSVNRAALTGWAAALDWLEHPTRANRLARARGEVARLEHLVAEFPGITVLGHQGPESRLPTLAFTVAGFTSTALATALLEYGVMVGSGLQCAPLAHQMLGSSPDGAVRVSAGPSTTSDDIDRAVGALRASVGA